MCYQYIIAVLLLTVYLNISLQTLKTIKENIADSYVWVSFDKPIYDKGCYIAIIIVFNSGGKLVQNESKIRYLLASKIFLKNKHITIANFFYDSMSRYA